MSRDWFKLGIGLLCGSPFLSGRTRAKGGFGARGNWNHFRTLGRLINPMVFVSDFDIERWAPIDPPISLGSHRDQRGFKNENYAKVL